jgi:hypothetical protein
LFLWSIKEKINFNGAKLDVFHYQRQNWNEVSIAIQIYFCLIFSQYCYQIVHPLFLTGSNNLLFSNVKMTPANPFYISLVDWVLFYKICFCFLALVETASDTWIIVINDLQLLPCNFKYKLGLINDSRRYFRRASVKKFIQIQIFIY